MSSEDLALIEKILTLPDTVPLTTEEVALAARVSESTIRKWACWRREGDLVPCAKSGRRNIYRASDVRRYLGLEGAV